MKVLHLEGQRRKERRILEALRSTQGEKQRRCHHLKGGGVEFLKSIWLEKFSITEDKRVKHPYYTEYFSQKGEKSFKIHNTEKNMFIREAGTRVQLKDARQSFL